MKITLFFLLVLGGVQVYGQTAKLPIFKPTTPVVDYSDIEYEDMSGGCSWYCGAPPITVTASSFLHNQGKNSYRANNVHDFNQKTAWVEGKKDYGIGEYIEFKFDTADVTSPELAITGMTVANGYKKSRAVWQENSRVKSLKMYINGKPRGIIELRDEYGFQKINFGSVPLKKGSRVVIRFEITDVYKGSQHADVALSEIEFDGTGVH